MNYYNEIENYIKKTEINKRTRKLEENQDIVTNYWKIGKLLVEAQGGSERAKYGDNLIKEWSTKFTEKYGSNYSYANMARFKQFYLSFPILVTVSRLSWSQLVAILPIREENKRNYYINRCIEKNLSVRELRNEIKNNSYERLINKPEKIELISPTKKPKMLKDMKNPILLELNTRTELNAEKDLEVLILAQLKNFFNQLGEGFTLVGNQYKVNNYFIDILLFNYKLNAFIVIELKLRQLKKEDKAQIEFYMQLIDEKIKEYFHNHTIGIIISKEQDKLMTNFVENDKIIPLTYEIRRG